MRVVFLLTLGLLTPLIQADELVPTLPKTPITVENAHKVRAVAEVPWRVQQILRGPHRGELLMYDWNKPAVKVVDDANFRTLRLLLEKHKPTDFAMNSDGSSLLWTEEGKTSYTVEDLVGGKSLDIEIGEHPGDAAFSPDGKLLAIGFTYWDPIAEGAGYSEMRLYDRAGHLIRSLERTGPGGLRPVFSPDGKVLAVGNRNYETLLFDVASGKRLRKLKKRMTHEIAFSPDGKWLAAGYVDGTVAVWEVATGKLWHSAPSGCVEIYSVDWNPKGNLLASSGRAGKIILWELDKFTKLKELEAPIWVTQVRFNADGNRLLSASASETTATHDRKVVIWAIPDSVEK